MSYVVRLSDQDGTFEVQADESILDAAVRAGVKLPHECTFGGCGTCKVKVHQGTVCYDEIPMALTEEEHLAGYALACQARCAEDLVIEPCAGKIDFAEPVQTKATVLDVQPLTAEIIHLSLLLPDHVDCSYRAGQYLNIVLPDGRARSFSMASASNGKQQIDLHIRRVPGGYFTNHILPALKASDTVHVELPLGTFCYREDDWRPMIMLATGTGIAPIRALLESLLDNDDCPPITLYWGMRTEADLYAAQELASWAPRLCDFKFVPVLSRASDDWQGMRGHVQAAVLADHDDLSDYAFYMCGSPEMISQATQSFVSRGADIDYIYSDSFTFSSQPAAQPA